MTLISFKSAEQVHVYSTLVSLTSTDVVITKKDRLID